MFEIFSGIWQFITDSYPRELTLKNVEAGSCYKENRSPESKTQFECLELKNVCQADRPLPPGIRGKFIDGRKRYEKEYYFPQSTKPKRSPSVHSDLDNQNSSEEEESSDSSPGPSRSNVVTTGEHLEASFHDISLSSSVTDLDNSFESLSVPGNSKQVLNTSTNSTSNPLEDCRPAGTSSPTPEDNSEIEKAPSQPVGLQMFSNHSRIGGHRGDSSQDFFESYGLSSPSSNSHRENSAVHNRQQHQFSPGQASQQIPNSSVQLFSSNSGKPLHTNSLVNASRSVAPPSAQPSAMSTAPSRKPGVHAKQTSQLFGGVHDDSFDLFGSVTKQPSTSMNQHGQVPYFSPASVVQNAFTGSPNVSFEHREVNSSFSHQSGPDFVPASQPVKEPPFSAASMVNAMDGSHVSGSMDHHPLESTAPQGNINFNMSMEHVGASVGNQEAFDHLLDSAPAQPGVNKTVDTSSFVCAPMHGSLVSSTNHPPAGDPSLDHSFEFHAAQPATGMTKAGEPFASPPMQSPMVSSNSSPSAGEQRLDQSFHLQAVQQTTGVTYTSDMVAPRPMQNVMVSPNINPSAGEQGLGEQPPSGDNKTLKSPASPPVQSALVSSANLPSSGNQRLDHSFELHSSQPSSSVTRTADTFVPSPMQGSTVIPTNVPTGDNQRLDHSFELHSTQPSSGSINTSDMFAPPPMQNTMVSSANIPPGDQHGLDGSFEPHSTQPSSGSINTSDMFAPPPMQNTMVSSTNIPPGGQHGLDPSFEQHFTQPSSGSTNTSDVFAPPPMQNTMVNSTNIPPGGQHGLDPSFEPHFTQPSSGSTNTSDMFAPPLMRNTMVSSSIMPPGHVQRGECSDQSPLSKQSFGGRTSSETSPNTQPPAQNVGMNPSTIHSGYEQPGFLQQVPSSSFAHMQTTQVPPVDTFSGREGTRTTAFGVGSSASSSSAVMQNSSVPPTNNPSGNKMETFQSFESGPAQQYSASAHLKDVLSPPSAPILGSFQSQPAQPFTSMHQSTINPSMPPPPIQKADITSSTNPSKDNQKPALLLEAKPSERSASIDAESALPSAVVNQLGEKPFCPTASFENPQVSSSNAASQQGKFSGAFEPASLPSVPTVSHLFGETSPPTASTTMHNVQMTSTKSLSHSGDPALSTYGPGSGTQHGFTNQTTSHAQSKHTTQLDSTQKLYEPSSTADAFKTHQNEVPHAALSQRVAPTNASNIGDNKTPSLDLRHGQPCNEPTSGINQRKDSSEISDTISNSKEATSESILTRVGSDHSAFHSISPLPSPRHSNMSLTDERACETTKSPLRSPVQKDKKDMYHASNTVLSSLWENGSQLTMPGLIMPAVSGQQLQVEAIQPVIITNTAVPTTQQYIAPPGSNLSVNADPIHPGTSPVKPVIPTDSASQGDQLSHHQATGYPPSIQPAYPSTSRPTAHQNEVPPLTAPSHPTASFPGQGSGVMNENVVGTHNSSLKTGSSFPTYAGFGPSQPASNAHTLPSEVPHGIYQWPGSHGTGHITTQDGTLPSMHHAASYYQQAPLSGHSNEPSRQNFHPDVSHFGVDYAGIPQNEHQQGTGGRAEVVNPGHGGHIPVRTGGQFAYGQFPAVEQQLPSHGEHQQQRQPAAERYQVDTSQYPASESYEDYDSEEEENRYYDQSGHWFWSYKRKCWIPANSGYRGYDDRYSDYHRSDSRQDRYDRDRRERSDRHRSRGRPQSSQKTSRNQDADYHDYRMYNYRDYYPDYYRRRSDSSGSSGSYHRGSASGRSSGSRTPRLDSSRSSSRASRSRRSKHRSYEYDYEDGYRKRQDYYGGHERQSSRNSRRRSESSGCSDSGGSNSLSDSIKESGYSRHHQRNDMVDYQLERVPTPERLTPKQHFVPHIICRFAAASRVCLVPSRHVADGEHPQVVLAEVKNDTATVEVLVSFPGPLRRGHTHKRDVVRFAKEMALTSYNNVSRSFEQREASFILWEVLALMVQLNGVYDKTDIAEVLMTDLPDHSQGTDGGEGPTTPRVHHVTFQDQSVEQTEDKLSTYRDYLLCGKTKDALEFAIKAKMWAHALTLSHQLGSRIFSNVMTRFTANLDEDDSLLCLYQHLSQKRPTVVERESKSWRKHLAMMVANPSNSPESDKRNIFALGQKLENRGIYEAAHLCYILAGEPVCSDNDMVLLGTKLAKARPEFVDPGAIQRTEIYEYAMTLRDEKFTIPDYQAWKVLYAHMLAEAGLHDKSYRYCEMLLDDALNNPTNFSSVVKCQIRQLSAQMSKLVLVMPGLDLVEKLKQLTMMEYDEDQQAGNEVPHQHISHEPAVQRDTNQAVVAHDSMNSQVAYNQVEDNVDTGVGITSQEQQVGAVPLIPTVPTLNSSELQTFHPDPYQSVPGNDAQAGTFGQTAQDPYNAIYTPTFVPQEPAPNQGNFSYNEDSNNQATPPDMANEEANVVSRQPSEIHFYGAPSSNNGSNEFYEGDSFEHIKSKPKQNEPSFTQFENYGVGQPSSDNSSDYYSMSSYQSSADKKVPSVKDEPAPAPNAKDQDKKKEDEKKKEKQGSGWSIGGFFKSLIPKGKNEMILPDDKNKSIYWDEKLGKWVNTEESEEDKADLPPPPPIDPSLIDGSGPSMSTVPAAPPAQSPPSGIPGASQPGQVQPSTTPAQVPTPQSPPTSVPGRFAPEQPEISLVNTPLTTPSRFSRRAMGSKGRKSNYVDVLNASGSTTKTSMDASPMVFQPFPVQSPVTGTPAPLANDSQSGMNREATPSSSSQTNFTANLGEQSDVTDSPAPAVPFFNPADYASTPPSTGGRGTRLYPRRK